MADDDAPVATATIGVRSRRHPAAPELLDMMAQARHPSSTMPRHH
jgi:hypothetical protein